ncbi:TRAP transporter substrate-binding protein [Ferrovibrio xuzhouensis]|uniref:TRAP transporter substrate-binding protein n=1 Tax=Ferrovibrio xuzhouensis TaxID=1576914 RepID=A0ABV7VI32_9PROT
MARLVTVAGLALVVGLLLGIGWTSLQRSALSPVARAVHEQQQPVLDTAPTVTEAPSDHRVLTVASSIPTTAIEIGTMAVTTAEKLARVSDGRLELKLNEPGTLFPTSELFDKLSNGDVDAVWASTNFFAQRDSVFWLFSTVPFGPPAGEYLAWLAYGGGQELMDASFARFNIKPVVCTVLPPESGGWFRREITGVDDLKGLKMRFMGIGARVIAQLGVDTVALSGGDTFYALQSGAIEAAEFSLPAIDLKFGFDKAAGHYYFPGWHQQASLITLLVNAKVWESLSDAQRGQMEAVCGDNIRESMADGEVQQVKALQEIRAKGIAISTFPPAVLSALKDAWENVVREESAANPEFRKAWESYSSFRESYAAWKDLGYLP